MFSRRLFICSLVATNLIAASVHAQTFWHVSAYETAQPVYSHHGNVWYAGAYQASPYRFNRNATSYSWQPMRGAYRSNSWSYQRPWYQSGAVNNWYSYGARPQYSGLGLGWWNGRSGFGWNGPLAGLFRSITTPWNQVVNPVRTTYAIVPAPHPTMMSSRWNRMPAYAHYRSPRVRHSIAPQYVPSRVVFSPQPFGTPTVVTPRWQRYAAPWQPSVVPASTYVTTCQPAPSPWQPHIAFIPEPTQFAAPVPVKRPNPPIVQSPIDAGPVMPSTKSRRPRNFVNGLDAESNPVGSMPSIAPSAMETGSVRPRKQPRPTQTRKGASPGFATKPVHTQNSPSARKPKRNPTRVATVPTPRQGYGPERALPGRLPATVKKPVKTWTPPKTTPKVTKRPVPVRPRSVTEPVKPKVVRKAAIPPARRSAGPRRVVKTPPVVKAPPVVKPPRVVKSPPVEMAPVEKAPAIRALVEKTPVIQTPIAKKAPLVKKAAPSQTIPDKELVSEISEFERGLGIVPKDTDDLHEIGTVAVNVNLSDRADDLFGGTTAEWLIAIDRKFGDVRTFITEKVPVSQRVFAVTDTWPTWWPAAGLMALMVGRWISQGLFAGRLKKKIAKEMGIGMDPSEFRFESASELPSDPVVDPYPEAPVADTTEYFQPAALKSDIRKEILSAIDTVAESQEAEPLEILELQPTVDEFAAEHSNRTAVGMDAAYIPDDVGMGVAAAAAATKEESSDDSSDPYLAYLSDLDSMESTDPVSAGNTSNTVNTESLFDDYVANLMQDGKPTEDDSKSAEPHSADASSADEHPYPSFAETVDETSASRVLEADGKLDSATFAEPAASTESMVGAELFTPDPLAVDVEPVAVEPVAVEPVAVEPVAVEPIAVEPVAVEPVAVEPVAVEPVVTEPTMPAAPVAAATEPASAVTEPASTATEPASTVTEPASTTTEPAATVAALPTLRTAKPRAAKANDTKTVARKRTKKEKTKPVVTASAPTQATASPDTTSVTQPTAAKSVKTKTKPAKRRKSAGGKTVPASDKTQPASATKQQSAQSVAVAEAPEIAPTPKTKAKRRPGKESKRIQTKGIDSEADDLTRIYGLTVSALRMLEKSGIRNFNDLANRQSSDIKAILEKAGSRFCKVDPTSWPEQAALAADGNWSELKLYKKN